MLKLNCLLISILFFFINTPVYTAVEVVLSAKMDTNVNQADTSVQITNKSSKNAKLYKISFGDGEMLSGSELVDYSHKYKNFGRYTIILVVLDTVKGQAMADTAKATIEFSSNSVGCAADFDFSIKDHTVTVLNTSPGDIKKLIWYMGDGTIIKSKQSFSHTYNRQGAFDIKLYVKKANLNCESELIKTAVISDNQNIPVSLFDYLIDSDTSVTFTNNSLGKNLKCQWTFGDGSISNEISPVYNYRFSGVYKVYLKVIDSVSGNKSVYMAQVKIPEKQGSDILAGFNAISDPENDTIEFRNTSIGSNIKSYLWDFGDGTFSSEPSPIHVYRAKGIYNVCLSISSDNSAKYNTRCEKISAGISNVVIPDFSYIKTNNNFTFIYLPNQTPDSVRWDFGDGSTSNQIEPSHAYTKEDAYLVSLKHFYNGMEYEALKVVVNKADYTGVFGLFNYYLPSLKGGGAEVHFKSSLSGEVSRVKYVWDFGDGSQDSTSAEPYHEYATSGSYNVCLTVFNYQTGGKSISCKTVVVEAGTSILNKDLNTGNISIYPNPSKGNFYINVNLKEAQDASVTITDISGKTIETVYTGKLLSGQNIINANIRLKRGVYACKVSTNSHIYSQLLLIY